MATMESRYDEESGFYVIGFEQDGAFVPTSSIPESTVAAHVEAVKNAKAADAPASTSGA